MRVLEFVISLEKGGRTKLISELSHHLQARGHRVKILTLTDPPRWVMESYLSDLEVLTVRRSRLLDLGAFWKIFSIIAEERFEVIHANCEASMAYGGIIGRILGVPVIGTYHRSALFAYQNRWQSRVLAALLTKAVAVSSQRALLLKENLRIAEEKLCVIRGAIDLAQFEAVANTGIQEARGILGLRDNDFIIFSAGHLGSIKGHDDSIQALALLERSSNENRRRAMLYIAGDGSPADYERLRRCAEELDIVNRVVLLGQISTVPLWLTACDIFLLPSHEEAFGLVFAEAGAVGRPVVATKVGGIVDIVLDGLTGLLVSPHAPQEVAAALEALLLDQPRAVAMGERARERVRREFTIERLVNQYENLMSGSIST